MFNNKQTGFAHIFLSLIFTDVHAWHILTSQGYRILEKALNSTFYYPLYIYVKLDLIQSRQIVSSEIHILVWFVIKPQKVRTSKCHFLASPPITLVHKSAILWLFLTHATQIHPTAVKPPLAMKLKKIITVSNMEDIVNIGIIDNSNSWNCL